jgi:hypothetical protein
VSQVEFLAVDDGIGPGLPLAGGDPSPAPAPADAQQTQATPTHRAIGFIATLPEGPRGMETASVIIAGCLYIIVPIGNTNASRGGGRFRRCIDDGDKPASSKTNLAKPQSTQR